MLDQQPKEEDEILFYVCWLAWLRLRVGKSLEMFASALRGDVCELLCSHPLFSAPLRK